MNLDDLLQNLSETLAGTSNEIIEMTYNEVCSDEVDYDQQDVFTRNGQNIERDEVVKELLEVLSGCEGKFISHVYNDLSTTQVMYTEDSDFYVFEDTVNRAFLDARITGFSYVPGHFRKYFTSPFQQHIEQIGLPFTVVKQLPNAEDPDGGDGEEMYLIKFEDGQEIEAWGHEVCKLRYDECVGVVIP